MARKYTRDNRGRFASGGGGATARGGRLRTASGNKRKTQTMKAQGASGAGVMKGKVARDPGALAKPSPKANSRKQALAAGSAKYEAKAQKVEAQIKTLESAYRSKGSAFYTQGVKTGERDRMHGKMQKAAALRAEVTTLRQKSANAARMAGKIKEKPAPAPTNNSRVLRARAVAANAKSRPTKWKQKMAKSTALRAQAFYDNPSAKQFVSMRGNWKLPRSLRGQAT